jgi:hypothetical protein
MRLLPWQQNLLAQLVAGLAFLGSLMLLINPRLVYFHNRQHVFTAVAHLTHSILWLPPPFVKLVLI